MRFISSHETRNIVNQLFDLAEVPVPVRQVINDRCDEFVQGFFDELERRLAEAEAQLHTAEDAWLRERDAMSARLIELNEELAEEREKRQRAVEALRDCAACKCQYLGDGDTWTCMRCEVLSGAAQEPQEPTFPDSPVVRTVKGKITRRYVRPVYSLNEAEATQEGKKPQSNGCQDCQAKGYKCAKCYSESCLCGGVGCNSCEPRGPY
jgi:hypothetical protein